MKVPPPSPPPDGKKKTYDKDRTLTRRTVKGAAGGMLGVDYEDDRRADPNTKRRDLGMDGRRGGERADGPRDADGNNMASVVIDDDPTDLHEGRDESQMLLDEEGPASLERRRRRRQIGRDPLGVDKDAPERRRRKKWGEEEEDDEYETSTDQLVELLDTIGEGGARKRAHLFDQSVRPEPGDLSLLDPEEIKQQLGSPASYAKHVMILSEAFRRVTGARRDEAIDYLARLFVAVGDRSFGRVALKQFGPSTGILDIYPLEVIEHILARYPGFLTKVGYGRFLHVDKGERLFRTSVDRPIVLQYPEDLKIRGFALRGGGCPGYHFAPTEQLGAYELSFQTAGRFEVLISATNRSGHTMIERITVEVRRRRGAKKTPPAKDRNPYPQRNAARIRAWPIPEPPAADPLALLDEAQPTSSKKPGLLSAAELAWRQAADAIGEGVLTSGPYRLDRQVDYEEEEDESDALESEEAGSDDLEDYDEFSFPAEHPLSNTEENQLLELADSLQDERSHAKTQPPKRRAPSNREPFPIAAPPLAPMDEAVTEGAMVDEDTAVDVPNAPSPKTKSSGFAKSEKPSGGKLLDDDETVPRIDVAEILGGNSEPLVAPPRLGSDEEIEGD